MNDFQPIGSVAAAVVAGIQAKMRARIEAKSIPEPNSGCWIWLGALQKGGYPHITVKDKSFLGHRLSWQAHFGSIPDGMHVLHRCDNPCCVNPGHLFLGTHFDNMADKVAKGRQAKMPGMDHPGAILTDDQVREIWADTRPLAKIAEVYGVNKATVTRIKYGGYWSHINPVPASRRPKPVGELQGSAKLTADTVRAIRVDDRPQNQIAADYGISRSNVSRIKSRHAWAHVQ